MEDTDNLKIYMEGISQYGLLTREEEASLAQKAQAGDEEAKNKLIKSNLRLVVKIAHDFKGHGVPLIDLISEGNLGLIKAVGMFDPSKGAKLSSYAAWWIKQYMRRAIYNQSPIVRIPTQNHIKALHVRAARRTLSAELGREPTESEIAEKLNITPRMVANAKNGLTTTIYLDGEIRNGEDSVFSEIIADPTAASPDTAAINQELSTQIQSMTDVLDSREREIIVKRFGLDGQPPMTLDEVSRAIGRTRERVRQLQNSALQKLKQMMTD